MPCRPISTLLHVKQALLSAAQQTKQQDPAAHSSSDGKSYPGWADMDAADDIGLFLAGSAGGESSTVDGMTTFMPIDQDAAGDKTTVSKAGLRDADVVCVGFRAQGAGKFRPSAQIARMATTDTASGILRQPLYLNPSCNSLTMKKRTTTNSSANSQNHRCHCNANRSTLYQQLRQHFCQNAQAVCSKTPTLSALHLI